MSVIRKREKSPGMLQKRGSQWKAAEELECYMLNTPAEEFSAQRENANTI
jgi:hypothetical protein